MPPASPRLVRHLWLLVMVGCATVASPSRSPPAHPGTDTSLPVPDTTFASDTGSVPPFNREAAARALSSVDVSTCAAPGGPTGPGHVTLVFAIDGGVSSVRIDRDPYADTLVGTCIAEKFRGLRVPAFEGPAVTVGKSFRVE